MNRRIIVIVALAASAGCKKTKGNDEVTAVGSGSAAVVVTPVGSGSGIGSGIGSGSAVMAADPTKPDSGVLARGEYIAAVTACAACHTPYGPTGPDFKRLYGGGMEIAASFGTWRSSNISPDKGTGIGSWTDDQILAAIREGVRPDGGKLYPIMPYLHYNRMTDADGKALVAYLRTVPAVENAVAPNKLKLPELDAPKPANAADVTDDPLKHGEYLVTLMQCGMCHTPFGPKGMPDGKKAFAGGLELDMPIMGDGKMYGSNITSDPETGIGKWTEEQIAQLLKTMVRPDGKVIQGPMLFYQAFWSRLEDNDLKAIAAYVKQIPAVKNKVPTSTFMPKAMPSSSNGQ